MSEGNKYNPYNRTMYDKCSYDTYVQQTSAHINYQLYPSKYVNCSTTCDDKPKVCGTDKQMNEGINHTLMNRLDIEEHLIGRRRNPGCGQAKKVPSLKEMESKIQSDLQPKDVVCSVVPNRQKLNQYNKDYNSCGV